MLTSGKKEHWINKKESNIFRLKSLFYAKFIV